MDNTKEQISSYIESLKASFDVRSLNYLPRWVVLFLDVFVLSFTFLLTYFLLLGLKMAYVSPQWFWKAVFIYLIINLLFFRLFKTYAGIIRFSSFIDGIKFLFSQICSFVSLVFLNYFILLITFEKPFLTLGLFINFVFSFSLLFFYRIIVKQLFEKYFKNSSEFEVENVLIYGSDANAIAVANSILAEVPKRFKIQGFISKNKNDFSKRLLDLPILNGQKNISVLIRSCHAQSVILADKSLENKEIEKMVDDCLNYNYKVYKLPTLANWENAKEISKSIKKIEISDLLERKEINLSKDNIKQQVQNKTILISGAAGSIGSEIVRQLAKFTPKKIIALDQAESALYDLGLEIKNSFPLLDIQIVLIDIRKKEDLNEVFALYKPQLVYHAAAYKHVPLMEENPKQAIFTNILGTKNMADVSLANRVKKFVMVSTDKAVNPSNVMGASKRIAECYVKAIQENAKTKFITTRFGNVLGSNGSVVPLFTKQIQEGGPITLTQPDIIRYFMTITEACQLVLEAGAMGNGGEIFIFDMGDPVKIKDLAIKMIKLAGLTPGIDIKIDYIGLRPGEKLYEELLNDKSLTLPTYHHKIMIAKDEQTINLNVLHKINDLLSALNDESNVALIKKMKNIVPEFKSMNSIYENLDSN
jgi:FlaA1/EpsC-like NDP-sugar epimerase